MFMLQALVLGGAAPLLLVGYTTLYNHSCRSYTPSRGGHVMITPAATPKYQLSLHVDPGCPHWALCYLSEGWTNHVVASVAGKSQCHNVLCWEKNRKPWFLPLNMGVSCKFSLKPTQWFMLEKKSAINGSYFPWLCLFTKREVFHHILCSVFFFTSPGLGPVLPTDSLGDSNGKSLGQSQIWYGRLYMPFYPHKMDGFPSLEHKKRKTQR